MNKSVPNAADKAIVIAPKNNGAPRLENWVFTEAFFWTDIS